MYALEASSEVVFMSVGAFVPLISQCFDVRELDKSSRFRLCPNHYVC